MPCGRLPHNAQYYAHTLTHAHVNAHTCAQVVLRDGTQVEAYEHGMSLGIVALRGSVPTQWVLDFRQGLGR